MGCREPQLLADVLSYLGDGSRGQRDEGDTRELLPQDGKLAVFRPEVMAPFRYAVCLVDCDQADPGTRQGIQETGLQAPFRGDKQEPEGIILQPGFDGCPFPVFE